MPTVPIEKLDLDPNSPRLLGQYENAAQEEIRRAIAKQAGLTDLKVSFQRIGANNLQPLCVVAVDDRYRVIDGNRRLAAILDLNAAELPPERWTPLHDLPVHIIGSEEDALQVQVALNNDVEGGGWPYSGKVRLWRRLLDQGYDTVAIGRLFGVQTFVIEQGLMAQYLVEQANRSSGGDWFAGRMAFIDTVSRCLSDCMNVRKALGLPVSRTKNRAHPNPIASEHEADLDNLMCNLFQLTGANRQVAGAKTAVMLSQRRLDDLDTVYGNEKALRALNNGLILSGALHMAQNPERYDTSHRSCATCGHWSPGAAFRNGSVPNSGRCGRMTAHDMVPIQIHTRFDYACDQYTPNLTA